MPARHVHRELDSAAESAHASAQRGDFGELRALMDAAPEEWSAGSWASCLRALQWLAGVGPLPDGDVPVGPGAVLAAGHRLLAAVLRFDLEGARRARDEASSFAGQATDELWVRRASLWCDLLDGARGQAEAARALGRDAARASIPVLAVEGTVLCALALLEDGAGEEATQAARRGVRMARAEAIVQQEYLASMVLARVRRRGGEAHLAARILNALEGVLPPSWARWLEWELAFAGTGDERAPAAGALTGLLRHARDGTRDAFDDAREALIALARGSAFARRDAQRLIEAVDPTRAPSLSEAWTRGGEHRTCAPVELRWGAGDDAPPVFAWMTRGGGAGDGVARRILASGVGLITPPPAAPLDPGARRDARPMRLLVVLALHGARGGEEAAVFHEVYGFVYVRTKHDGVFRVLIHRARALLGDRAELRRADGHLTLLPRDTLLLPDPRCARTVEERVMHHLGATGGALGARDLAEALGINLRAAQRALRALLEGGACTVDKQGRAAMYRLEDTTFVEPTRSRVSPGVD